MKYRIKELRPFEGRSEVILQCKGAWGGWRNIWRRPFACADRDYALLCAEEVKEKLEADI